MSNINAPNAPALAIGEYVMLGDVNIIAVTPKNLAELTTSIENYSLQLTADNSYRIAASSADDVELYACTYTNRLMGPWLKVNAPALIESEHGNIVLQPGCYAATYRFQPQVTQRHAEMIEASREGEDYLLFDD